MPKKTSATAETPKADKTNQILVSVVLDRSGSMGSSVAGTISGYNEYLNGLRADKESEYFISLTQFDSNGAASAPELTEICDDVALAKAPELNTENYQPRGGTPLYDAIGECARRVESKDRAVIMVVITDGHENASREFTRESVKALIKAKEAAGWTFVFLGADIDSYSVGSSLGLNVNSTANYTKGAERSLYSNLAGATMMRSAAVRMVGVQASATMAFFDDSQKLAMDSQYDPNAVQTGGTGTCGGGVNPSNTTTPAWVNPHTSGGLSPVQPSFRPTKETPVDGKRRDWKTTTSNEPIAAGSR